MRNAVSRQVHPDEVRVVIAFLRRYLEDRAHGRISSLQEYQRVYPGYEVVIAREFEQITGGPATGDRS